MKLNKHRGPADVNALNVIFIGANDIGSLLTNPTFAVSTADEVAVDATISLVISRLDVAIKSLLAKGARKILLVNLPNFLDIFHRSKV